MKDNILVVSFCVCLFFTNIALAETGEKNFAKLNSHSIELLDISIPMLVFVLNQPLGGNLIETSAFEAETDKKKYYQVLEKKGYIDITKNAKPTSASFSFLADSGLTFVQIKLTEKGKKIKNNYEKLLQNELK